MRYSTKNIAKDFESGKAVRGKLSLNARIPNQPDSFYYV